MVHVGLLRANDHGGASVVGPVNMLIAGRDELRTVWVGQQGIQGAALISIASVSSHASGGRTQMCDESRLVRAITRSKELTDKPRSAKEAQV